MYELLFTTNEKMKKPEVIEVYADNGQLSHYALIDTETGNKLWSEAPEECKAMGYPVVSESYIIHECNKCMFEEKLGFCPKCDTDCYSH